MEVNGASGKTDGERTTEELDLLERSCKRANDGVILSEGQDEQMMEEAVVETRPISYKDMLLGFNGSHVYGADELDDGVEMGMEQDLDFDVAILEMSWKRNRPLFRGLSFLCQGNNENLYLCLGNGL